MDRADENPTNDTDTHNVNVKTLRAHTQNIYEQKEISWRFSINDLLQRENEHFTTQYIVSMCHGG